MPRDKPSLLLTISRSISMAQILNKEPFPSPLSENVQAPPSTPIAPEPSIPISSATTSSHEIHNENMTLHRSKEEDPMTRATSKNTTASRKKTSFFRRLKLQPTLVLENSGSVARDHLASERTFLAYVRTSLLLATTGVALVQLFAVASTASAASATLSKVKPFARPLGAVMIGFGLFVLIVGLRRYFLIQSLLLEGLFPASRFLITAIALIIAMITIIIFGVLVSART